MQPVTFEEAYTMSLLITQMSEQEKSGTVWYPELACRTELTLIHCAEQLCKFAEIPDRKSPKTCVPDILTLRPKGRDKLLAQFYYKTNRQPLAEATLVRVVPVEGKPAIEQ
jgi:hypothetical protein